MSVSASEATIQTLVQVTSIVTGVVQALAVVVVGVFAYYKFARGRTFFRRADWSLHVRHLRLTEREVLHVRVTLRNAGAAQLALHQPPVRQRLQFLPEAGMVVSGPSRWQTVPPADGQPADVLAEQLAVEPGETIVDEALVPLPTFAADVRPLAWRLTMTVHVRRRALRPGRRSAAWPATTIVLPDQPSGGAVT